MKLILDPRTRTPEGAQQKALELLEKTTAKYVLLSAPVGSGKSHIAMAAAIGAGTGYIVTPQNILVDQYVRDFGLPDVKGRRNYRCRWALDEHDMDCEDASDYKGHASNCEDYVPARDAFWGAEISVTNAHYATLAKRFDGPRGVLVIDECHGLEGMLLGLHTFSIRRRDVITLGLNYAADFDTLFQEFVELVPEPTVEEDGELTAPPEFAQKVPDIMQRRRILGARQHLGQTDIHDDANPWYIERMSDDKGERIECKPLFARQYASRLLELGQRVLFMSGTPGTAEPFFRNLGITGDTDVVEVDSQFPRGRGIMLPPHADYVSTATLDRPRKRQGKNETLAHWLASETVMQQLTRCCAEILRQMPNSKGLILCASYAFQLRLYAGLKREFSQRLIMHTSEDRVEKIAEHCGTPKPTVLMGVDMHEGLDLKGDLARFLIIPKVLHVPRSGWGIRRDELDKGYLDRVAVCRMVQGCGRVIRDAKDEAYIVILDNCLNGLKKNARAEFPAYFLRNLYNANETYK
jgi:Rad3-related DNA helicase